jgi:hypothetical protein
MIYHCIFTLFLYNKIASTTVLSTSILSTSILPSSRNINTAITLLHELNRAKNIVESIPSQLVELHKEISVLRNDVKQAIEGNARGLLTDSAMDDILSENKRRRDEVEAKIRKYESELKYSRKIVSGGAPNVITRSNVKQIVENITVHGKERLEIKYRKRDSV